MLTRARKVGVGAGIAVAVGLAIAIAIVSRAPTASAKSAFEEKYQSWLRYCSEDTSVNSEIDAKKLFDNRAFRDIVKLGISIIPFVVEKQQEDHLLGYALHKITKLRLHTRRLGKDPNEWVWTVEEFPDIRETQGPADSRTLWLRWWREGRSLTDRRFASLYLEWRELKREEADEEAQRVYRRMIDLGIAALPNMMDKIKEGRKELIPAVSELTDGDVDKAAEVSECIKWWKENKEKWLIPFPEEKASKVTLIVVTIGILGVAAGLILVLKRRGRQIEARGPQNPR